MNATGLDSADVLPRRAPVATRIQLLVVGHWRALRRSVLLTRGARENAHESMLEIRLRQFERRQAGLALATPTR